MGLPIFHSQYTAAQIEASIGKTPRIKAATRTWEIWDISTGAYVDTGVSIDTELFIDSTLTEAGYAADARTTGVKLAELRSKIDNGLLDTDEAKQALLACFANVAWIGNDGQDYYDALYDALYPPTDLVSISAVYTQSGTVYNTDSLNSLRSDLVVRATYSDSSMEVVTNYTLSGTLAVGTSTITVKYGGKTDTFTVTVTAAPTIATFEAGAIGKGSSGAWNRYIWKQDAAARARMTAPILNNNYVFTVTDNSKYQLCAYDPETNVPQTISSGGTTRECYYGGTKTAAWATSDSVTTDYVWLSLKKLDNTEFTAAELANGAAAVFTYTES